MPNPTPDDIKRMLHAAVRRGARVLVDDAVLSPTQPLPPPHDLDEIGKLVTWPNVFWLMQQAGERLLAVEPRDPFVVRWLIQQGKEVIANLEREVADLERKE